MLFNSIEFIIFFIFILSIIAILKYRKFQHIFLLISSYVFFYFSSNYLVSLLIFSTILDFYIGKELFQAKTVTRKKILLIISLSGNLGLLGFFKYVDFGIEQFNNIFTSFGMNEIPFLNVILPIGISFYTFQTMSYTIDIYRGHLTPSSSLKEFALFVAFFPQLVAGPILRAKDFLPQLREKTDNLSKNSVIKLLTINHTNLKFGITLMAFGFLKKVFFADNIAPLVNHIFDSDVVGGLDSFSVILGTIAFGVQIYGDFSGYSDIAIGAALILGFKIPLNFNKPYFATSPADFWRRWHISLSTWLRDYLYIPLGGSKKSSERTYLNLFTVMFLGGLWHGASWNFVIWGVLHGSYLAIHRILVNKFPSLTKISFFKTKLGKIIAILITQYFVFLAWIPFRVHDVDDMIYAITKYIFWDFQTNTIVSIFAYNKFPIMLVLIFLIFNFISYKHGNLISKISSIKNHWWIFFITGILLLILLFYDGSPEDFIYFRF